MLRLGLFKLPIALTHIFCLQFSAVNFILMSAITEYQREKDPNCAVESTLRVSDCTGTLILSEMSKHIKIARTSWRDH